MLCKTTRVETQSLYSTGQVTHRNTVSTILFYFYFLRQGLALLPRLEGSGTISAHYNLRFPDSSNSHASASQVAGITGVHHHPWLIFVLLVKMGFHHIGQASLKLLASGDLPTLTSQSARIRGLSHHAQPTLTSNQKKSASVYLNLKS